MNAATGADTRLTTDRLSDRLAARLMARVELGELTPGDRLPTEQQLAEAHGVSRTVVREAVHQLRSQGVLVSRQGSGVYVATPAPNKALAFDPRVLGSLSAVVQIVEVRRALEGEIAALAAERASRAQIATMRRALRSIEQAVAAGGDGVDEDLAFHRTIADASCNPQFSRLLGFLEQYLREAMRVTRDNEARHPDFGAAVRKEHQAIFDAIAARDADAARQLATRHMELAASRLEAAGIVKLNALPARKGAAPAAAPTRTRK
jgi:GntR family transcriptional repressor for pyruvate dehydrogenase complex